MIWELVGVLVLVAALTADDSKRLEDQRTIVTRYLTEQSKPEFETASGKLGTLRALLEAEAFQPDQTYDLQSRGFVFGDVFVQDM